MYGDDPARSEVRDLQGAGELFLRRQASIGVLRIRFDRAAARMRLLAPATGEALRDWLGRLDAIVDRPATEQFVEVGRLLDAFDRWARGPLVLPRPASEPEPEPVPEPPVAVLHQREPLAQAVAAAPAVSAIPIPDPDPDPDEPTERTRTRTTLVPSEPEGHGA